MRHRRSTNVTFKRINAGWVARGLVMEDMLHSGSIIKIFDAIKQWIFNMDPSNIHFDICAIIDLTVEIKYALKVTYLFSLYSVWIIAYLILTFSKDCTKTFNDERASVHIVLT